MCKSIAFTVVAKSAWIRTILMFSVCLLATLSVATTYADSWLSPKRRDYLSENGRYLFRVVPSLRGEHQRRYGTCRGTLYAKEGEELKLKWDRPLVNDLSPVQAFVSNSGKYVFTIGEWGGFEQLPVVVYAGNGTLINIYGQLRQIIPYCVGRPHPGYVTGNGITSSIGGRHWFSNSLMFFSPNEDFFIVRMSNKEIMVFETKCGQLINNEWKETSSPDRFKKYDDLKQNLERLIALERKRGHNEKGQGN